MEYQEKLRLAGMIILATAALLILPNLSLLTG